MEQRANVTFLATKFSKTAPQSAPYYLHPRNQKPHQGVDVLCSDGSTVYAPFNGMILGQEKPFRNKSPINNGVRLSGRGKRAACTDLGCVLGMLMLI